MQTHIKKKSVHELFGVEVWLEKKTRWSFYLSAIVTKLCFEYIGKDYVLLHNEYNERRETAISPVTLVRTLIREYY